MQSEIKLSLALLLTFSLALHAEEKSAKPDVEPLSRYQAMIDRSPFALATEAVAPPAAPNGFTKNLVLTGAVRLNSGEYITVSSRDQAQRFSLRTGEIYNQMELVSVEWSVAAGKTKATLKKGTEFGTISFDEAAVRAGPVAPQPRQGTPVLGQNGQQIRGDVPAPPQPPQTPGAVVQPQQFPKNPVQNPAIIRRRMRNIPAPAR